MNTKINSLPNVNWARFARRRAAHRSVRAWRTALCCVRIGTLFFTVLFFAKAEVVFANGDVAYPVWISGGEEYMAANNIQTQAEFISTREEKPAASSYQKTFLISAYYSPIQGQNKYVTGSLSGDIRLNGSGVNGADGTPVYPGMIAAPKTYPFGTKMEIPGIGVVAVHDRGGAIVTSGNRGNSYDRLDVWMGYGDEGLQRALKWGKRPVNVTVYGLNPNITEAVVFEGVEVETVRSTPGVQPAIPQTKLFSKHLTLGSTGEDVAKLQNMLKDLNYYNGEITSVFDQDTYSAVSSFQIDENIVANKRAYGSGFVGPRTMSVLASITPIPTAYAKEEEIVNIETFTKDLKLGDDGDDVRKLQVELRKINLLGIAPTGYYGEVTEHAVFKFQQINRLAGDKSSNGAGIFGPITRSKFNTVVAARLETERLKAERA